MRRQFRGALATLSRPTTAGVTWIDHTESRHRWDLMLKIYVAAPRTRSASESVGTGKSADYSPSASVTMVVPE